MDESVVIQIMHDALHSQHLVKVELKDEQGSWYGWVRHVKFLDESPGKGFCIFEFELIKAPIESLYFLQKAKPHTVLRTLPSFWIDEVQQVDPLQWSK